MTQAPGRFTGTVSWPLLATTLIGCGLSNTEIAASPHVSLSTAKTHVGRLLMKLTARDRAQLVIAAYDAGLVGRSPSGS
jgi:DNA-binding NarL/FixJ family response regulator